MLFTTLRANMYSALKQEGILSVLFHRRILFRKLVLWQVDNSVFRKFEMP